VVRAWILISLSKTGKRGAKNKDPGFHANQITTTPDKESRKEEIPNRVPGRTGSFEKNSF